MTSNPVNVPSEVMLVCAAVVTVAAVPDVLPVTLPVTLPSIFATKVSTAYPVPLVFTVVVGAVCKLLNNFHFPLSLASLNNPEYKS